MSLLIRNKGIIFLFYNKTKTIQSGQLAKLQSTGCLVTAGNPEKYPGIKIKSGINRVFIY